MLFYEKRISRFNTTLRNFKANENSNYFCIWKHFSEIFQGISVFQTLMLCDKKITWTVFKYFFQFTSQRKMSEKTLRFDHQHLNSWSHNSNHSKSLTLYLSFSKMSTSICLLEMCKYKFIDHVLLKLKCPLQKQWMKLRCRCIFTNEIFCQKNGNSFLVGNC